MVPHIAVLCVVMVAALIATLAAAQPTVRRVGAVVAAGQPLTASQLLAPLLWLLAPLGLTVILSVAYAGVAIYHSDGAYRGTKVRYVGAWRATLRRIPRALAVVLAWGGLVLVATVAAPAITAGAIVALVVGPVVRHRTGARWPQNKILAVCAIPFALAFIVAVRLSLALPAAWLHTMSARRALRASWGWTSGRSWRVAALVGGALLLTLGGSVLAQLAGAAISRDLAVALATQLGSVVAFTPLVFVALAVLYRRYGSDDPAPPVVQSRGAVPSPSVALVAVIAMIPTLVPMMSTPAHALIATSVDISSPAITGEFGSTQTITGTVTPATATGQVELYWSPDGTDDGNLVSGSADTLAIDGSFSITTDSVPIQGAVQVRYGGDAGHSPSQSAWMPSNITAASPTITLDSTATITGEYGQPRAITVTAGAHEPVELYWSDDGGITTTVVAGSQAAANAAGTFSIAARWIPVASYVVQVRSPLQRSAWVETNIQKATPTFALECQFAGEVCSDTVVRVGDIVTLVGTFSGIDFDPTAKVGFGASPESGGTTVIGAAEVEDGVATISYQLTNLDKVAFNGALLDDPNVADSMEELPSIQPTRFDPTVTITASPSQVSPGEPMTLSAQVLAPDVLDAIGPVSFDFDTSPASSLVATADAGGAASVTICLYHPGELATTTFSGDCGHKLLEGTTVQAVYSGSTSGLIDPAASGNLTLEITEPPLPPPPPPPAPPTPTPTPTPTQFTAQTSPRVSAHSLINIGWDHAEDATGVVRVSLHGGRGAEALICHAPVSAGSCSGMFLPVTSDSMQTLHVTFSPHGFTYPSASRTLSVQMTSYFTLRPVPRTFPDAPLTVGWDHADGVQGEVVVRLDDRVCSAPVTAGGCTGTFTPADFSRTQTVTAQLHSLVRGYPDVTRTGTFSLVQCWPFDLEISAFSATGDRLGQGANRVDVLDPPRCKGGERYEAGTSVGLRAMPAPGYTFSTWRRRVGPGQWVDHSDDPFLRWQLAADPDSYHVEAVFEVTCHPVDVDVIGSGDIAVHGSNSCDPPGGELGFPHGTTVVFEPSPGANDETAERDAFYSWVTVPEGSEHLSLNRLLTTVNGPLTVTAEFGPDCRIVETPATDRGDVQIHTPYNCIAPGEVGYTRGTVLDVTAVPDDPDALLTGWIVDGEDADVGQPLRPGQRAAQLDELELDAEISVSAADTTVIAAQFTFCYPIEVEVRNADFFADFQGDLVRIYPEPNCIDGSGRWMEGTSITLRPHISGSEALLGGWIDDPRMEGMTSNPVTTHRLRNGETVAASREFPSLDGPIQTTFSYLKKDGCSRLEFDVYQYVGNNTTVDLGMVVAGELCGSGFYYDEALEEREENIREGRDFAFTLSYYRGTYLRAATTVQTNLDLYGYVRLLRPGGGDPTYPMVCDPDACTIRALGDAEVVLEACQKLEPVVNLTVSGEESGKVFHDVQGLSDFNWVVGGQDALACGQDDPGTPGDPTRLLPNHQVTLRTRSPGVGFTFDGWGEVDNEVGRATVFDQYTTNDVLYHPVARIVEADTDSPTLRAEVNYTVHCGRLHFGRGMSLVEPQPNCPGAKPGELLYINGSIVTAEAAKWHGDDPWEGFYGNPIKGSAHRTHRGGNPRVQVLIDGGTGIAADYLTDSEQVESAVVQGLKLGAGLVALGLTAGMSVACGPCGVGLTFLVAAGVFGDKIPGLGGGFSNIVDALNPMNVLKCATQWSFATGDSQYEALKDQARAASATRKTVKFTMMYAKEGFDEALDAVTRSGAASVVIGGATVAAGLVQSGAFDGDYSYADTSDLRDTSRWTSCMKRHYDPS